ncbi:MAG: HNH endonuclease [Pseudoalteromonas sp.]|nr:HNH endonuclease [Pseudoalteromonas sp.]
MCKFRDRLSYDNGELYWNSSSKNKGFKGKRCGGLNSSGYVVLRFDGKLQYAHRVIYSMMVGDVSGGCIDHVNGNRADNRLANLRLVSRAENNKNSTIQKNNVSGVTGVHFDKGTSKFRVQISVKNKTKHIGVYGELSEAVKARKNAEIKFGFHKNHGKGVSK